MLSLRHVSVAFLSTAAVAVGVASAVVATADTRELSWTTVASQPFGTVEASGLAVGGKLYSFGGFDATKVTTTATPTPRSYVYTPATDRWTAIRPLPAFNGMPYGGVSHAGIATNGTDIFLAGGYSADTTGNRQVFGARDVFRYSPATDTYTRLPSLPAARASGLLEYVGGRLHFTGGVDQTRTRECPEHWALDLSNPSAGWVTRAPLPNPRNHLTGAVVGGKIYAIGGQRGQDAASVTQDTVNRYDPATNTWATLPALPRGLNHSAATVLDGQILLMGGQTWYNTPRAVVFAMDPVTFTWSSITPLPLARYSGTAGTIGNTVYYTGGSAGSTVGNQTWKGVPVSTTPTTPTTPVASPVRINFQPAGRPVPAGYTADTGGAYSAARGSGWVREDSLAAANHAPLELTGNARDRELLTDQRLDTFMHMQAPAASSVPVKTPGAFELAVPSGSYRVTVTVGDPAAVTDSVHRIRVEGAVAVAGFTPTSATRSQQATVTVSVTDGRLTVDAVGGTNTKLNFIDVTPL